MNFNKLAILAVIVGIVSIGTVKASTDGSLGTNSTGTFDVSISVPGAVQVSNLKDVFFGEYAGIGDVSAPQTFCVHSRGGTLYNITLTSANQDNGVFRLNAGSTFLPYTVKFDDSQNPDNGSFVDSGELVSDQQGASPRFCANSDNASVRLTILEADIDATPPGIYTDVVTVFVSSI